MMIAIPFGLKRAGLALVAAALLSTHALAGMPPASNRMSPDTLPTPFSAEEIRQASPPGHTTVFRIQLDGEEPMRRIRTFLRSEDPEVARFRATEETRLGEPIGPPMSAEASWTELQGHAAFPEALTRISEDRVSTPAGDFDCWVYTLTRDLPANPDRNLQASTSVTRFWFAKSLPGPPVMLEQEVNGRTIMLMTLLRVYQKDLAVP